MSCGRLKLFLPIPPRKADVFAFPRKQYSASPIRKIPQVLNIPIRQKCADAHPRFRPHSASRNGAPRRARAARWRLLSARPAVPPDLPLWSPRRGGHSPAPVPTYRAGQSCRPCGSQCGSSPRTRGKGKTFRRILRNVKVHPRAHGGKSPFYEVRTAIPALCLSTKAVSLPAGAFSGGGCTLCTRRAAKCTVGPARRLPERSPFFTWKWQVGMCPY